MPKKKLAKFTAVQAVKSNARDRLGTPPPERVLPDPKDKALRAPKHKQTLATILEKASRED